MLLKKAVSAAVPAMIAVAAFLHAQAIGALVDGAMTPASIAPFAEARAAEGPMITTQLSPTSRAKTILDRNIFDSTAKPRMPESAVADAVDGDPMNAPNCDGVRAIVAVRADEPDASFAAFDVGGKRHLQRRGGAIDDVRVVYVGSDRVWLSRGGAVCQARLGAPVVKPAVGAGGSATAPGTSTSSPLEKEIGAKIQKTGPNEYAIDRGAVSRIIEAQAELMKTPLVPEKEGDQVVGYRLVRIKPGSVLSMLGLESGDRLESLDNVAVTSAEGMMQAYAKLSTGTLSHMTIHVTRAGKPLNLDYNVK